MNIYEYIKKNINAINNFQQVDIDWIERYKDEIESSAAKKNVDFTRAVNLIKRNTPQLSRENVCNYYSDDIDGIYNGFIATILWGHIFVVNLRKVIAYSKEDITRKIKKMLADVNTTPAIVFQNMKDSKNKEYHIDGINVSFFTKIFYFTSHIHGNTNLFILDKKMWDAYNAFHIANGSASKEFNKCTFEDYKQYCDYLCSFPCIKKTDRLEAFLFEHNDIVKTFLPQKDNDKMPRGTLPKALEISNNSDIILPQRNKKDIPIKWKEITLNGEPFLLFVAERPSKWHFCKLSYKYEDDPKKNEGFDINSLSEVQKIIQSYTKKRWYPRQPSAGKTFKYVKFEGDNAESEALNLYSYILSFIDSNI